MPLLLFLQHKNARILVALPRRMAVQMAAEKLKELLGETELGEYFEARVRRALACFRTSHEAAAHACL